MPSCKASAGSSTPPLLFLDLRTHGGGSLNGPAPVQFWQTTTRWRGEQWTPSIGVCPNVVCASRLSSILQVGVPEKYYLSRKACEGILRRASRRGKQLPELLKMALEHLNTVDRHGVAYADSCDNYINHVAKPKIYDARGNGDGITSPTMTGDHNSRITDYPSVVIEKIIHWIVRRLTPTECERLQGYPDGWTDLGDWVDSKGKAHKAADTPRYKALGNSIALPQWYYVLGGIADRLPDDATLGSLFDGIGGFPYVWAQLHAGRKELCVWASEMEEFPIAVTKKWFPEA